MEINAYLIVDLLTGIILIAVSLAIYYLSNKSLSAKLFSLLSFVIGVWSILIAVSVSTIDFQDELFLTQLNHFLGTSIATIFLLFSLSYPYEKKIGKKTLITLLLAEMMFICLLFFTNLMIDHTVPLPNLKYLGWIYGPLVHLFNFYFIFCWLFGIGLLFQKFRSSTDSILHKNLKLMLIAFIIGIIPPTITTIILPQIGIFDYYWLSPLSGFIWVLLIAYSITTTTYSAYGSLL